VTTSEPLFLVNGSPTASVSPLDRGLSFGDGVFRTLRMEAGEPIWWDDHYDKLAADCRQLALINPSRSEWEQDIAWIAARQPESVLRLSVTRGLGPRGYRVPEFAYPTRLIQATPLPAFPDPLAETGVVLRVCDLRLGHQPRLAGAKHLNRLENVLARMEWDDAAIDEGVLLDHEGQVISGVMSNLFILSDGLWLTPDLSRCGVAGVTRARLMRGLDIREARFDLDTLLAADVVLLSNSLIRLRWVARLRERYWTRPAGFDNLLELLC
jgi:4-amino-4-deoxychorismate lyase